MSIILDTLPNSEEFFQEYWNKKPFVIRKMIPEETIDALIDEDHLAGLSMEEEVESRLVKKGEKQSEWACDHGPFEETDFAELGAQDWSLLVQNTDQYHDETAELLKHFNFSPRWLLDDIMVSFSPKGGTVGAHTDSYHVFLVQGKGRRSWKVAHNPIKHEDVIENIPLKILKDSFDGEEVTVTEGDVIYIPPKFAHQGISLEPSLTYSVGFLGPSVSEMLADYGQYIEENHPEVPRYLGKNLTQTATPFHVASEHVDGLKHFMTNIFDHDIFAKWIVQYFANPAQNYDDDEETEEFNSDYVDIDDLISKGIMLIKPPKVKIMLTPLKSAQRYCVSIGKQSFELDFSELNLIDAMSQETPFSIEPFKNHKEILHQMLEDNILEMS